MKNINKIISGISALYMHNIISYSPKQLHLEMPFGTNTSNYNKEKYKISIQSISTLNIGVVKWSDKEWIYRPERLFIDFNKFSLESTVKREALNNFEKIMNPEIVRKLYEKLKNKRRGIDDELILKYLEKHLMNIDVLIKNSNDAKSILREYAMALLSKKDIPITIIKGGSSIELYTNFNRSTLDIDTHTGEKSINSVLNLLGNKENLVYFIPQEKQSFEASKKKIIMLHLIPQTRKKSIREYLENIVIPISFNTSYSNKELIDIIETYKLSKRSLKRIKNASAMIFSREMLLAEKYQSLVSKPEHSTREKDLLDLFVLWNESIDFNLFVKWLSKKWSRLKKGKIENWDQIVKLIINNKDKELTKIKMNFNNARLMYDVEISFEQCLEIYQNISNKIIENYKNTIKK